MLESHRARAKIAPRSQRSIRTLPYGVALVLAGDPPWKPPVICGAIPTTASTEDRREIVTRWLEAGLVMPLSIMPSR
ncbi:MAG: hypothetical protein ABL901_01580 [Hyphomicrobiaceae bacterium]